MKTPKEVNKLQLHATCVNCGVYQWEKLMENTTKANGERIRLLIKKHLPELYDSLALNFYNPYESKCVKKPGLLVYVHSAIEYFLIYE